MHNNLSIPLDPRFDSVDNIFHIGKLSAPILLDLSNGATFLVFLAESGEEELQIAVNDKANPTYSRYHVTDTKIKIRLDKREDRTGQPFYVCKVRHPGLINCSTKEAAFLVFTSKEGIEEIQISGDIVSHQDLPKLYQTKDVEVVNRQNSHNYDRY